MSDVMYAIATVKLLHIFTHRQLSLLRASIDEESARVRTLEEDRKKDGISCMSNFHM
jgi:hypothetical protein